MVGGCGATEAAERWQVVLADHTAGVRCSCFRGQNTRSGAGAIPLPGGLGQGEEGRTEWGVRQVVAVAGNPLSEALDTPAHNSIKNVLYVKIEKILDT